MSPEKKGGGAYDSRAHPGSYRGQTSHLGQGPAGKAARHAPVHLLRYASSITALDSAPEMHELFRRKTGADRRVRYVSADAFSWEPDGQYDVVFFANWLSHVPPGRFDRFWEGVRAALAPGGRVFFADELEDAWRYEDLFREDFVDDPSVPIVHRSLLDGRTFRVVKVFWNPDELRSRLGAMGWDAEIHPAGPFFWAEAIPRDW